VDDLGEAVAVDVEGDPRPARRGQGAVGGWGRGSTVPVEPRPVHSGGCPDFRFEFTMIDAQKCILKKHTNELNEHKNTNELKYNDM